MNSYKIEVVYYKDGKVKDKAKYFVDAETEEEAKKKLAANLRGKWEIPGCVTEMRVEK